MIKVWNRSALAALAVFFPMAAFGDIVSTVTLTANQALNLDTGVVGTSGDLLWNGSSLNPQGSAKAANITALLPTYSGQTGYDALNQAFLSAGLQGGFASSNPLTSLSTGIVIGAISNGGHYAKLLITAVTGSSISFQYTSYGATATGGGPATPTITAIQNNYSYILPGLPNYGIAPGTLFIIKGSGLATATTPVLQSSAAPGIPKQLNGASVTVTVNGVTTNPGLYYAIGTQIAAVLPASTPVGTGTITVTNGTAPPASASITVVPSALGLDTLYGTGAGLGVATNATTGAVFNYTSSAAPGQTIVLWGSGAGANTADSDYVFTTTPHAVSAPPTIYIGGIQAQVLYAGASGYPGVNQINVTIPSNVQPGCGVSVVAVSGSIVSNTVTLPIAAGGGVCVDTVTGTNGTQITNLGGKTTYSAGTLAILQTVSSGQTLSSAAGIFQKEQGSESASGDGIVSVNSCIVNSNTSAGGVFTTTGLDAGNLSVTGPNGTTKLTAVPTVAGFYSAQLANGFIPATGGSYTFTGTGGANVGAFSTSVSYTNPLNWTNSAAITSVNRAGGVNVTWTGGATGSYVYISGGSSSASGTVSASFTCYAPASAGQFTVPSYVLLAMPAGPGSLSLENIGSPVSFNASGLDQGIAIAGVQFSTSPSYN